MIRNLAALAATLALASPTAAQPVTYSSHPAVVKVQCETGSGTAVAIAPQTYVTARHVSVHQNCRIAGKPIMSINASGKLDFDLILADGPVPEFYPVINCDGFKAGETYFALGHARGGPQRNLVVKHFALGNLAKGELTPLFGPVSFIPGQSGGGVFNVKGELVGIINAYSLIFPGLSFSRALRDTAVCQS